MDSKIKCFKVFVTFLFLASLCACKSRPGKPVKEDRGDNSFQHNVDYRLDESGERFKLQSSGKLSDVIDLDNVDGIKVLLARM